MLEMSSFRCVIIEERNRMAMNQRSFIETQFPVSKVSKESYKERKAGPNQTLTGLGKWWGRKPLILVRAALIGLLLPSTDNPQKDLEMFLRLMTMDEEGMWLRKKQNPPLRALVEVMTEAERRNFLAKTSTLKWKTTMDAADKANAIRMLWSRFSYDQRLAWCLRPEETALTDERAWKEINTFYGTDAHTLPEFMAEMSERRFGHRVVVGDCFSGGGSVPFEAARLGFDVFASDLNPIAGLLTWADLHIAGASEDEVSKLREFQRHVYDAVDKQVEEWGIERNEAGDRAKSYLYCNETSCPECGWHVPLAPSWIIGHRTNTAGFLQDNGIDGFDIIIKSNLSIAAIKKAEEGVTVRGKDFYCPHCKKSVPISAIRHDSAKGYGLRLWEKDEFLPRPDDVFRERLYCIKYEEQNGKNQYYTAPTQEDFEREKKVVSLLAKRFSDWQKKGYIPSGEIDEGYNTSQIIRERGWKYWHQLFTPRQLLVHGRFIETIAEIATSKEEIVVGLLGVNKLADWDAKLSRWKSAGCNENSANTFSNQALNTIYNYAGRGMSAISPAWYYDINNCHIQSQSYSELFDAQKIIRSADLWLTDPPYADAVNYHELTEFFLAWDKTLLKKAFPDWYTDSKRVLAVRGKDESFNRSMVDIYKNLAEHMPDDGMQIIMFTHQDVAVWADLAMVVWSAGLQVTAAWNIITETDASGLKNGNYVKGTVLLVLRKQQGNSTAYLDELMPDIEDEVKRQIESMQSLDDKEDPNFTDADYILAAYAAALKVLTSVSRIEDINVEYELSHQRERGEVSEIAKIIEEAKKIAYDQLIPHGFDHFIWRMMEPAERFYIKGLEAEKNGIYQISTYQELARGFGVTDYRVLLADTRANSARLRTGGEWKRRTLDDGFGATLLRHVLMALYIATKDESSTPLEGKTYLRAEVSDYWNKRDRIQEILKFITAFSELANMSAWHNEAEAAKIIKELVANDGI